ncbi:MAG: hypothetical protein HY887_04145 [Deltaproteobacteria bacterium]|nr:hypothetical protein [Deltaproteobacteria bacterium]
MEDIMLSSSVTVAKYRQFVKDKAQSKIADFVLERFTERYITPLSGNPKTKHGFCTMAVSCLLIEALESFRQGWPNTDGKSKAAFSSFFSRCSEQGSELGVFSKHSKDFYINVRCGILHQAETTNGWLIHRKGPLFDPAKKIINATKFHKELGACLQSYCDKLKCSDWDDEVCKNLRKKMVRVIKNCKPAGPAIASI